MIQNSFLWTDIESTGLHTVEDHILEVAFVLTDSEFNELASFERVIKPRIPLQEAFEKAEEIVRAMHTDNGLWRACEEGVDLSSAAQDAFLWLNELKEQAAPAPLLAGASLHALDWPLLQRDFKAFCSLISHKVFDVSTMKRMGESWTSSPPHKDVKPNELPHRAMSDCRFTIEEAKTYRDYMRSLYP